MIHNSHKNDLQKDRDQVKGDETKDKSFSNYVVELTKANSQYIINFWENLEARFKADDGVYGSFEKIEGMMDEMKLLENNVFEKLNSFREDILIKQVEKDKIEKRYLVNIDANIEEIVQKSKDEIQAFKKEFRKIMKNIGDTFNKEATEKELNQMLDALKDKLFEMELFTKKTVTKLIGDMEAEITQIADEMNLRTSKM